MMGSKKVQRAQKVANPPTSLRDIFYQSTQEAVSLIFSKESRWKYVDSTAVEFDPQDPYFVRITLYVNWCLCRTQINRLLPATFACVRHDNSPSTQGLCSQSGRPKFKRYHRASHELYR